MSDESYNLCLTLSITKIIIRSRGKSIAVSASASANSDLNSLRVAGGVGLGRRLLVEQPAEIDELLLRRLPLAEPRGLPFGGELLRRHGAEL